MNNSNQKSIIQVTLLEPKRTRPDQVTTPAGRQYEDFERLQKPTKRRRRNSKRPKGLQK